MYFKVKGQYGRSHIALDPILHVSLVYEQNNYNFRNQHPKKFKINLNHYYSGEKNFLTKSMQKVDFWVFLGQKSSWDTPGRDPCTNLLGK